MSQIFYWLSNTIGNTRRSTWEWFAHLDRQQWLVVLAVTTAAGFLCLRGFGSRDKY